MKKGMTWCLLASLIVVGILVAGCSKGGSTASSPTASSPPASSPTASSPPAPAQGQPSGSQSLADLINKGKLIQSVSADITSTTSDGKTSSGTIWVQGKMFKFETTVNGTQEVMIYNYNDSSMIVYQPATGRGSKMKLSQSQNRSPGDLLNEMDPSKVQDLGTAVINGETCRVLQYTDQYGTTIKMWLIVDLGFPAQINSTLPNGTTTTADYTNIKVGPLPSDTFSVPAGVKIIDMTNMNLPPQQ